LTAAQIRQIEADVDVRLASDIIPCCTMIFLRTSMFVAGNVDPGSLAQIHRIETETDANIVRDYPRSTHVMTSFGTAGGITTQFIDPA
jgi:hypothetical protein